MSKELLKEFTTLQAIKEIIRDYVEMSIDDLAWKLYEETKDKDVDMEEVIDKVRDNLSLDLYESEE